MDKFKRMLTKLVTFKIDPIWLLLVGIIVFALIIKIVTDWSYQTGAANAIGDKTISDLKQQAAQYRMMFR